MSIPVVDSFMAGYSLASWAGWCACTGGITRIPRRPSNSRTRLSVIPPQLARMIKRLRVHGLLKKIGKRYKYYLTKLGRIVVTTALKLRELFVIPSLNEPATL